MKLYKRYEENYVPKTLYLCSPVPIEKLNFRKNIVYWCNENIMKAIENCDENLRVQANVNYIYSFDIPSSTKVVDMTDIIDPYYQHLKKVFNKSYQKRYNKDVTDEGFLKNYANSMLFKHNKEFLVFLVEQGVDLVKVKDSSFSGRFMSFGLLSDKHIRNFKLSKEVLR